jgi:hypothetical protein
LLIISPKTRTIENDEDESGRHPFSMAGGATGPYLFNVPPYPPPAFVHNKELSRLIYFVPLKTKKLQALNCGKTAILHSDWGSF